MQQQEWSEVDEYLAQALIPTDPLMTQVLENNRLAGLPPHDVSPLQGQFLALMVMMTGARRVLEIGTLGGYSTIWLARALPEEGLVVTLEANAEHAQVAAANLALASVTPKVQLRVGPAVESLPLYVDEPPFDVIFIDADKPGNPIYLEWALSLSRSGTLIIGDNVVRGGAVTDPQSEDLRVQGVRTFIEMLGNHPRLRATALQTVGHKGWDGFTLAVVK
ncbi:O-methyltransferase [Cronobacter condimenti 1330]|uniref:Methyltransferase n=1 Tax=Cronobacter condimenti 1330 TaxID=1073999 RepID=K8A1E4_9ENTR|nr:O-methyltransferase [Cronobacter condimenti]ALB62852.1 methyltransferase [Cronobacter condimenti 1330]CCJ73221.1 O-methyltransferase [Cronobacter condimenti 1330]